MTDHELESEGTHKQVSEFYGRLAKGSGGCCAREPGQRTADCLTANGGIAASAGYPRDQIADVPADAVESSFGCGDPLALAEVRSGEIVVDLGAGAGLDVILAARRAGPAGRVIGIDMTDEMIAKARANIERAGLANAEIRKGLIEDLPVESGSVDLVISNCVVNLSPDKPRVFAEIARVLKPGGRMLVSDIVVEDLPEAVRHNPGLYVACVAGAISEADYVAGLAGAGLAGIEIRDRLIYDAAQVEAMIRSEIPGLAEGIAACGAGAEAVEGLTRAVAGKVWSARIFARKPHAVG